MANVNTIDYFKLDLNNISESDKFIMRGFNNEKYFTDMYAAVNTAQQFKVFGRTYNFKYYPKDPSLFPKIYNQNDLVDLNSVSMYVENPYDIVPCTSDPTKPCSVFYIKDNGIKREVRVDEVDKSFIIILKSCYFYNNLYSCLEIAKEYKSKGKSYFYFLKTPKWFKEVETFNKTVDGRTFLLLWYNKDYLLKKRFM